MRPDALLFWERNLIRPTKLIHLKLQYENYASIADSRRMIQVACRAIIASPRLQHLALTGLDGIESFPLTPEVISAIASHSRYEVLHLTSIGNARLNQEALEHLRAATNLRCVSVYSAGAIEHLHAFLAHLPPSLRSFAFGSCSTSSLLNRLATLLLVETWCPRLSTMRLDRRTGIPSGPMRCSIKEFANKVLAARGPEAPALEGTLFRRVCAPHTLECPQ
jgi:hypothetical protein